MSFVLDASSMVAILLPDEDSPHVIAERLGADPVVAPSHWVAEVTNGLVSAWRGGRISAQQMRALARDLSGIEVAFDPTSIELATGAILDLTEQHGLTTYDAAYLELALRLGLGLATHDGRLRRAARAAGVPLVE
jgi:predicted nucleic acid-binding protein